MVRCGKPTGYLRYGGVLSPREGDAVGKDKERKREHFWQVVKYTDFFELRFSFFVFFYVYLFLSCIHQIPPLWRRNTSP